MIILTSKNGQTIIPRKPKGPKEEIRKQLDDWVTAVLTKPKPKKDTK